ncbi:MAG: PASTA domain-containing protein [Clostridia bacterium]|nr:PASTA domain-containing protein [Clostridia bacterium]
MGRPPVTYKRRLAYAWYGVLVVFLSIIFCVFYRQIIMGEKYRNMALSQWTRDTSVAAERGEITDANGVILAQSGTTYKILVWPKIIKKAERARIATELSAILELDYESVLSKVSDAEKSEIVLKRKVEREIVDKILALKLGGGVGTGIDTKRYYPNGELFAQLLGFTTIDNVGQYGLEQKYDKYLAGEDGRAYSETDGRNNALAYGMNDTIAPVDGCDLVLTTNSAIQAFMEKALEEALEINKAKTAQGILMNCKTGEIIAISTQPDFDPNEPPRSDMSTLNSLSRNRIVADAYEPGSTFKILTLSAAVDSGAVNESTSFDCPGFYVVNGETIKCWKHGGHGSGQSLAKAAQNSCNPAFMRMALRMGKETFYDYLYAFGLGSSTGSGMASESSGIVTNEKYVNDNTLARIGFGQSVAVTPIQLATAVSAAVNGGNLLKPYIVKQIISQDGEVVLENSPTVVRRVISEESSQKVRAILESVVSEGSGKNAQIDGFRVGGKTGTAQKYEDGSIADGKLIASFIGFAPADDPTYVCLILVDEPKVGTIFGSTVAAPFVKDVLEETLYYYGHKRETQKNMVQVPSVEGLNTQEAQKVLEEAGFEAVYQGFDAVIAQLPASGEKAVKGSQVLLYTAQTDAETNEDGELVKVPDVMGMTRLEASDTLKEYGLEILIDPIDQAGTAIRQSPEKDTEVKKGSKILVEFSTVN